MGPSGISQIVLNERNLNTDVEIITHEIAALRWFSTFGIDLALVFMFFFNDSSKC